MGREVRMVPPNWEHPRDENGKYRSLHGENYEEVAEAWIEDFMLWRTGKHPSQKEEYTQDYKYFWEYDTPPDPEYYVTYKSEEATWYQVYQTVSEGYPVTPPFATQDELIDYLVKNGDFWDQERKHNPFEATMAVHWTKEMAEKFVKNTQWAPSFIAVVNEKGATIKSGVEDI